MLSKFMPFVICNNTYLSLFSCCIEDCAFSYLDLTANYKPQTQNPFYFYRYTCEIC
jgi:hypothetical protein